MGCDIHIHAEIKVGGKWLHYDQPDCPRDYELFEKMAGVRGKPENAMTEPRGLPEDATETTRFDSKYWGADAHTHSWLTSMEISLLSKWEEQRGRNPFRAKWDQWLFGNHYSDFHDYPADRVKGLQDVRFVFWFDN